MKTTFICLCFLIIGHRNGSRAANYEEFKPTPIPLNEWKGSMTEGGAAGGLTLHEVTAVDPPSTAYYWEDALRHSVYLTLVRDKIDQLIAKGTDTKPDSTPSKVADDHNLWESIKTAPFDRLKPQEAPILGDITVLAKGRLLENKDGFRFAEDATSKEKCNDAKCMDGVIAFWSVKRVRQRDAETIPGKYHYELTFTIRSQTQKQHKKPHEYPVRTFTVLVTNPTEETKLQVPEPTKYVPRLQRAIWFHRNINPIPSYHSRKTYQGSSLDRLFFSLFSDDYEDEYQPRYKPVYQPQTTQQSKVGQVGPVDQYHQKKVPPYRYKPSMKYSHRPPVTQNFAPTPISHPPVQQLNDFDTKYPHQPDHKYLPTNIVKTTRNAVLPTPTYPQTNFTVATTNRPNATDSTTKATEPITPYMHYTKQKQPPTKVSYVAEHVRPPVFNAPPGVFVTMEKKPFKPMPPLKVPYYNSKLIRPKPPVDFRPSPQVLDAQFSDPEPLSDSFRPITMNYADRNKTELHVISKNSTNSKPSKKHENKKTHRTTTSTPEIITAEHSLSMDKITLDSMHWANNILGAFSKTTPMASEKLNFSFIDDLMTKPITTTAAVPTEATATWLPTTEEEVEPTTTEPSTTTQFIPKPKKRTRPPPKLPELKENPVKKIKKHKRITSTTSTSTAATTTTGRARPISKRLLPDLTPQASSAVTGTKDSEPEIQQDVFTTTSTTVDLKDTTTLITTTTPRPTPAIRSTIKTTTTAAPPTTTTATTTTEYRNKNRFRQTMLITKGTSVKHDKWSTTNNSYVDKTKTVIPLASKYQQHGRRKASNFHGYVSSTQKTVEEERKKDDHTDRLPDSYFNVIPAVGKTPDARSETITSSSQENIAEHVTNVESPPRDAYEVQYNAMEEQDDNTKDYEGNQETNDHSEYIFSVTTEESNGHELGDPELITVTEISVISTPYSSVKNKTKCKKKKHGNSTLTDEESNTSNDSDEILKSTTEATAVSDIFDEIFGFTVDDVKPNGTNTEQIYEGSEQFEHFVHPQDDLETFIESLSVKSREHEVYDEGDDDYPNNNEEESRTLRHVDIPEHRELNERPFSFLELMAME